MKFLSLLCLIGLIYTVQAGIYTNSPYEGIVWKAGTPCTINWADDNKAPLLAELDSLTIELYAGTEKYQHFVDTIATGVKGTALTVPYTVSSTLGPEGSFYFIKYTQGKYIFYSARFTITGITGTIPDFDPKKPDEPFTSTVSTKDPKSTTTSDGDDPINTAKTTAKGKGVSASGSGSGGSNGPTGGPPGAPTSSTSSSSSTSTSKPSNSQINYPYSFLMIFLTITALVMSTSLVY
jgi:hypothetical protein